MNRNNLIFEAVKNNNMKTLSKCLKGGLFYKAVDINSQDELGQTCLIIAAKRGYDEIGKYLIDNGADILIKNSKGETALQFIIDYNMYDCAESILAQSNIVHLLDSTSLTIIKEMPNDKKHLGDVISYPYGCPSCSKSGFKSFTIDRWYVSRQSNCKYFTAGYHCANCQERWSVSRYCGPHGLTSDTIWKRDRPGGIYSVYGIERCPKCGGENAYYGSALGTDRSYYHCRQCNKTVEQ